MRLFIAVPLPQELTDRAAALLPAALPALKRAAPELMHITLAFLGWMLSPIVHGQVLRAEVGYAGATVVLAALLALLYRRGTTARLIAA